MKTRRPIVAMGGLALFLTAIAGATIMLGSASLNSSAAGCNDPTSEPIENILLPGHPFTPVPSPDGCWVFVSLTESDPKSSPGIAVLRRQGGQISLARIVPIEGGRPTGMVQTHDGKLLIAADGDHVDFLDTEKLTSNDSQPILARINLGKGSGAIFVNVTSDDRYLFVSNESAATVEPTITVISLEKARRSNFSQNAIVGKIPTGRAPIGLAFSQDQRRLYATNEVAPKDKGWPIKCRLEGSHASPEPRNPEGAILVIDVEKAKTDPAHAVLTTVPSGCSPVRLDISPSGDRIYVTARADNTLSVFDTTLLSSDPVKAQIARIPVGAAPVGVAVISNGNQVVVTNSNRVLAPKANQTLDVIDVSKLSEGPAAVVGSTPAGAFPRELRVSADGLTLFLTNYGSSTLEVIDLKRLAFILKK